MPVVFGKRLSAEGLRRYVGDMSQVAGTRPVELADGPERAVRAVEVRSGSGLRFTVLPDRGLDIADAHWKGLPLAWISPTGITGPAYYEEPGMGWLRGFYGGLLVTCGLTSAGAPSVDERTPYGLHGRASNTPASRVATSEEWEGDDYVVTVSGRLRQARVFGENLELSRVIRTSLGAKSIIVRDRVRNLAYEKTPLMILYHINLGFPLVDEDSELIAPACEDRPRDDEAADGAELARGFQPPTAGYKEKVYYRDVPADKEGFARVALVNRRLGLGLEVAYGKKELPLLVQWKMMGEGHYVVGLEPSNCEVAGRARERERGALEELSPGEERELEVRMSVLSTPDEIASFEESMREL